MDSDYGEFLDQVLASTFYDHIEGKETTIRDCLGESLLYIWRWPEEGAHTFICLRVWKGLVDNCYLSGKYVNGQIVVHDTEKADEIIYNAILRIFHPEEF